MHFKKNRHAQIYCSLRELYNLTLLKNSGYQKYCIRTCLSCFFDLNCINKQQILA